MRRPAGLAGLVLWIALPLPGCHLGPFYDIYETHVGPDLSGLSELAGAGVKTGETRVSELLALLGPPSSIERRRETTVLTYRGQVQDRHWYGFGIGMMGFNLDIYDHDAVIEPARRMVFLVEDDRVTAFGSTISGLVEEAEQSGSAGRLDPVDVDRAR